MKILKNEKGSTLLLLIITIAVLTVLGTTVLSMAFMNYNITYSSRDLKETQYYSESGIEQAYALLSTYVDQSLTYAQTTLDKKITLDGNDFLMKADPLDSTKKIVLTKEETEQKIKDLTDQFFMEKMNELVKGNATLEAFSDYTFMKDLDKYVVNQKGASSTIALVTKDIRLFKDFTAYGPSEKKVLTIEGLKSIFTSSSDKIKTISTDILIIPPSDMLPYAYTQEKIEALNNPLWQYALVTQKDITFQNSNASIEGDVYALGSNPGNDFSLVATHPESPKNSLNYKGVILNNASQVDITGDVISGSYVQIGANSISSRLTMTDSLIYCNSMVVQKGSENGSIVVNNGNVYTHDDLELNGTNSQVNIDGSYYGYMRTATNFNQTSAIVLNSPMEIDNSLLKITGAELVDVENESDAGVLIAGVSFINDIFDPDPYDGDAAGLAMYQTGESMGIKNNIVTYTIKPDVFADGAMVTDELTMGDSSNLALFYKKIKESNTSKLSLKDKVEYFKLIFNTGTNKVDYGLIDGMKADNTFAIDIPTDKYIYTAGVAMGRNATIPELVYKNDPSSNTLSETLEKKIARDYCYRMWFLTDRPGGQDAFLGMTASTPSIDLIDKAYTSKAIENLSNIESNTYTFDPTKDLVQNGTNGVMAIANSDSSLKFYIAGSGHGLSVSSSGYYTIDSKASYVIVSDQIEGILITAGEVEILGDVEMDGSIIAIGSINIGNGNVQIKNNTENITKRLTEIVMRNYSLTNIFNDTSYISLDKLTFEEFPKVAIPTNSIDVLRQNTGEFILYQNWSIVQ